MVAFYVEHRLEIAFLCRVKTDRNGENVGDEGRPVWLLAFVCDDVEAVVDELFVLEIDLDLLFDFFRVGVLELYYF